MFSDEQIEDIIKCTKSISNIKGHAEAFVKDEKEIAVGDILTIKVSFDRLNLSDNEVFRSFNVQECGFVHSKKFPFLKYEHWYIIIGDESSNKIFFKQKITSKNKHVEQEFQVPTIYGGPQPRTLFPVSAY